MDFPADPVVLGRDSQTGDLISLQHSVRDTGLYVIGATGTGKSTLVVNLILQDIEAGRGVCFIEPHVDAINAVLARMPQQRVDDVILVDIEDTDYPFGINLFWCPNRKGPAVVTRTRNQVMHLFEKLWGPQSRLPSWGPMLEELLRNITLTLIENPGYTMDEIELLLTDRQFRDHLVARVTNPAVRAFWEQRYNRLPAHEQQERSYSTLNKVGAFTVDTLTRNIVGQSVSTIDFREAIEERKILLASLPTALGDDTTTLLGGMILGQLRHAVFARGELAVEDRELFCLYCDEYERFATADFVDLLTQGRKFGIATTIAHQFRGQFKPQDQNRGATLQTGNQVVFAVVPEDADELAKAFVVKPEPGEPVLKQRTRRAVKYVEEEVWVSDEAQGEFEELERELDDIWLLVRAVGAIYGGDRSLYEPWWKAVPGYEGIEAHELPEVGEHAEEARRRWELRAKYHWRGSGRSVKKALRKIEEQPMWQISWWLNPDWIGKEFQQFMKERVYNWEQPDLRGRRGYRLPVELPSQFEKFTARQKGWHIAETLDHFLHEFEAVFLPYKQAATYYFDPAGDVARHPDDGKLTPYEVTLFPEVVDWMKPRVVGVLSKAVELGERAEHLWKSGRKTRTRAIDLGYDEPVRAAPLYGARHDRWGQPLEEATYEWVEGPLRPVADVQNEMKNKLATLDPYNAWCRLTSRDNDGTATKKDYKIHTLPLRPGVDGQGLRKRRAYVQTQTRRNYCRPRGEVEQEISERQKQWERTAKVGRERPRPEAEVDEG